MEQKLIKGSVSDLVQDTRNANKGTEAGSVALGNSIDQYGAARSVVIDKDGRLIAGNKTAKKCLDAGVDEVIIVPTDGKTLVAVQRTDISLDSSEGRGLAIADNRVAEINLDWDTVELQALADEGLITLEDLWDDEELEELLPVETPVETEEDLDELNDAIADGLEERVQEGDIWKLGNHYIACADCLDPANIHQLMDKAKISKIDLLWSDPPYGVNIVRDKARKNADGKITARIGSGGNEYEPIAGDQTTDVALEFIETYTSMFPDAVTIIWGGNYFTDHLPPSPCWLLWDKRDGMGINKFPDAEVAWTNQTSPMRLFTHVWNGYVKASERGERRVHPTQKPVALATWAYERYSSINQNIFDPFLGSGMSLIAAQETQRTCIGFELSPHYCTVILERWERLTGNIADKVGNIVQSQAKESIK